jgi:hypothetical protein
VFNTKRVECLSLTSLFSLVELKLALTANIRLGLKCSTLKKVECLSLTSLYSLVEFKLAITANIRLGSKCAILKRQIVCPWRAFSV